MSEEELSSYENYFKQISSVKRTELARQDKVVQSLSMGTYGPKKSNMLKD